jgi:cell division protein FtsZ
MSNYSNLGDMMFDLPKEEGSIIKVIGVGGGGCNAVTHMFSQGITGVDFIISNTDAQSMDLNPIPTKVQLGPYLTEGRGAGSRPEIGKQACLESIDDIKMLLDDGTKMVFVTAGMGGGTGTGAAPIIAKTAKDMGILTVGIVTLPFTFEGRKRMQHALEGINEMKKSVDSLIVVSNDKLREIHGNLPISSAFANADNVLTVASKGIAEIITVPGYVNVDFEDVNTVMRDSGVAIMGTADVEGEDRARKAVDQALNSPLLQDNDIRGAQHILLNICSGTQEVTMDEIFEITEYIQDEAGHGTDLIWGNCLDESLGDKISVTIIATGFDHSERTEEEPKSEQIVVALDDSKREGVEEGIFDIGVKEGDEPTTIEFDSVQGFIRKKEAPAPQPTKREFETMEPKVEQPKTKAFLDDRQRFKNLKIGLNNPKTIMDLENQPAYARKRVNLEDVPHSSENNMSRYVITDDEEPKLRKDNSYLHDNVD